MDGRTPEMTPGEWIARAAELEIALYDLVMLERTQTPDMSGKRRKFACMRNGDVLADCLDRARALIGMGTYDSNATDPHHGGKIPNAPD